MHSTKKRLLLLGIFVLLLIFLPGYSKLQELKSKNKTLLSDVESLKEENAKLSRQVEKLETDPFYIEKKARDKMGIGKEGEIRYKFVYEGEEAQ
ncbi:septum formation initiator family protein [Candidatus Omnitrophota bacterium]